MIEKGKYSLHSIQDSCCNDQREYFLFSVMRDISIMSEKQQPTLVIDSSS